MARRRGYSLSAPRGPRPRHSAVMTIVAIRTPHPHDGERPTLELGEYRDGEPVTLLYCSEFPFPGHRLFVDPARASELIGRKVEITGESLCSRGRPEFIYEARLLHPED